MHIYTLIYVYIPMYVHIYIYNGQRNHGQSVRICGWYLHMQIYSCKTEDVKGIRYMKAFIYTNRESTAAIMGNVCAFASAMYCES